MKKLKNINQFITFNDFNVANNFSELMKNPFNLKQDMLQVDFSNDRILDIGWYPDFDPDGEFQVRVVDNKDWGNLVFYDNAKNDSQLLKIIDFIIKTYGTKEIIEAWNENDENPVTFSTVGRNP